MSSTFIDQENKTNISKLYNDGLSLLTKQFPPRCSPCHTHKDLADEPTEYEVVKDVVNDIKDEKKRSLGYDSDNIWLVIREIGHGLCRSHVGSIEELFISS